MRAASYRSSPDSGGTSPRRRIVSLVLTAIVHLLLLLMLLRIAPFIPSSGPPQSKTVTFDVAAEGENATPRPTAKAREKGGSRAKAAPTPPPPPPPKQPPQERPAPVALPPGFIMMSRDQFASSDIDRMPRSPGNAGAAKAEGSGDDSADADAGGSGGSERLYDVDWYRKPTSAELGFYLPKRPGLSGWGMIACRTAANYRVEDCREIGQSPAGSGFARAVREAAWQFRVLPPRVGSRPVIGAWVRIRIDYVEGTAKSSD